MTTACKHCPFRAKSKHGYTPDGLDCLDEDREPSCHTVVGAGHQFDDPLPTEKSRCHGHDAWRENMTGFQKPYKVGAT